MPKAIVLKEGLRIFKLTLEEFSKKSNIKIENLKEWIEKDDIPMFVFDALKQIARDEGRKIEPNPIEEEYPYTKEDIYKMVKSAFWGKNYNPKEIIKKAKEGDEKFLIPLLVNLFEKDAIYIIGDKNLKKHLEKLKPLLPKRVYETYEILLEE